MTPEELRAALKRLGMRQKDFAALCGTDPVTVNRWLSGERAIPHWLPSWLAMYELLTPKQRAKLG